MKFFHREQPLLGKRKKRKRIFLVRMCLVFGIFCLSAVLWGLLREEWHIKDIYVHEGERISHEEVRSTVADILAQKYFFIIPKSSVVLYPKKDIEATLLERFPRVKEVMFDRDFPRTLNITLYEYEPHALWCNEATNECYYVDETGFIFSPAPTFSEQVYFIYYGGVRGEPFEYQLFEPEYFTNLERFIEQLSDLGFVFRSIKIDETGMKLIMETGGEILLHPSVRFDVAFNNLASVLNDPEAGLPSVSDRGDEIEYIDLQHERKIYYKLRGVESLLE